MSAECSKCGLDIVYPEGSWPVGECPVCDHVVEITDEMVERGARALDRGLYAQFEDAYKRQAARAVLRAALDAA